MQEKKSLTEWFECRNVQNGCGEHHVQTIDNEIERLQEAIKIHQESAGYHFGVAVELKSKVFGLKFKRVAMKRSMRMWWAYEGRFKFGRGEGQANE